MTTHSILFPAIIMALVAGTATPSAAQRGPTNPNGLMETDSLTAARMASNIGSVVAAERAFRADVARLGVRDGFIRNFADDGVLFRPGPVNALEFLRAQPAQPGLLEWEPAFASVALSNDLGFTTGPWTYRPSEADSVVASGFYATVWKRDAKGEWRVAIDQGVGLGRPSAVPVPQEVATPRAATSSADPEALGLADGQGGSVQRVVAGPRERASDAVRRLDRELSISPGRVEGVARFLEHVSDDARFLRQGTLPITGRSTIESLLMSNPSGIAYRPTGSGMSGMLDFAYTWGGYLPGTAGGTDGAKPVGNYVHVWRFEENGWKLLFEVLSPYPPSAPKE